MRARFFWSVKWSQTVDDEDSRFLYLGFRIFCFCFFGPKKEEDFLERKKKEEEKSLLKYFTRDLIKRPSSSSSNPI